MFRSSKRKETKTLEAPAKKRGRPKGSKNKKTLLREKAATESTIKATSLAKSSEQLTKKGRGRPKGSKNGSAKKVVQKKKVASRKDRTVVVEAKPVLPTKEMKGDFTIPCELIKIPEFPVVFKNIDNSALRSGRYLIADYARTRGKYPIGFYAVVDWKKYVEEGYSPEQIGVACIRYLNLIPERRKWQRKEPVAAYGELDPIPVHCAAMEKFGTSCLQIVTATNIRKHKAFWGEGLSCSKLQKKRGRKPKEKPEETDETES